MKGIVKTMPYNAIKIADRFAASTIYLNMLQTQAEIILFESGTGTSAKRRLSYRV